MLNKKTGQRELAYVVVIDDIKPIDGSDNCESAEVGGWHIMVRKGTFKKGDLAIYFEIDSHLDTTKPEFAFLEKKHGNIKTQKYTFGGKGNFVSQGLLMSATDFGWSLVSKSDSDGVHKYILAKTDYLTVDSCLTERLGVTYYVAEDNNRKANIDKYKAMEKRNKKLFSNPIVRKIMRTKLGRKIMFLLFGKRKDKKSVFPYWVKKTDEDRCQNLSWLFNDCSIEWIATEKIDGTSTTFTLKRGKLGKLDYRVCSRNVCFSGSNKNKSCFYDTNVYTEMAEKYDMYNVLKRILEDHKECDFITIQGETYGGSIQKRNYGNEHKLAVFNLIFGYKDGSTKRLNPIELQGYGFKYNFPCVPIVCIDYKIPNTCDELLKFAEGDSQIDGGMREGLVFRSKDGVNSFKAVSNEFLLKYHN